MKITKAQIAKEQAFEEMKGLAERYGFEYTGELDEKGIQVFARHWENEDGKALDVKVVMTCALPVVKVVRDGTPETHPRAYTCPKTAFNAIGGIVRGAGFKM